MKVLIAHVAYRQRGGEDAVVETEARLLAESGVDVATVVVPSASFDSLPWVTRLEIAADLGGHSYGRQLIRDALNAHAPDVVHFHNLYPMLGVGALLEARAAGCATVQTLHNYRLSCIAGTHFRDGSVCEDCQAERYGPGIRRGCYRGSRLQSIALSRGVRAQGQLARDHCVPDVMICLTDFMKARLIQSGIPEHRLRVKPNGVPAPVVRKDPRERAGALYVGRLSHEKGICELVEAWSRDDPALRIVGTGPLEHKVAQKANEHDNVTLVGRLEPDAVRREIGAAKVVIMPSRWYEGGLPLAALEALAEGTPVAGFALGASLLLSRVDDGLLVEPDDFVGLKQVVHRVCAMDDDAWAGLSLRCVQEYEAHYTPDRSLEGLLGAYEASTEHRRTRGGNR